MAAFSRDELRHRNHLEHAFQGSCTYANEAIPSSSAAHGTTCHSYITQIILPRTFELQCAFVTSKRETDHWHCRRQHCTGPEFLPSFTRPLVGETSETIRALHSTGTCSCGYVCGYGYMLAANQSAFTRHKDQVDHLAQPGLIVLRAVVPRALETWLRSAF